MNLSLADDEHEYLRQLLENSWRDLKEEIYKTEDFAYKEQLKTDEQIVVRLLAKLKDAAPATS